jgi:hypothetical protein
MTPVSSFLLAFVEHSVRSNLRPGVDPHADSTLCLFGSPRSARVPPKNAVRDAGELRRALGWMPRRRPRKDHAHDHDLTD